MTQQILVTGGTGKTGGRIAARLAGPTTDAAVRIGSRTGEPPFDWTDPDTWKPALDGADALYLAYYPDIAVPGAAETLAAVADTARSAGVRRVVLLSGRGEPGAQRAEEAVRATGPTTVVRASWFHQNFSESYFLDPLLEGVLALPVGAVPEPFVDADDIADVAVAALTEDGHEGELYEVTGPRLLTFADAVGEIAAATGRDLVYVPITMDDYRAHLTGVPADVVSLLEHLFTEVLDGRNAHLGDGVQRALGRAPRDLADYARAAAATGVWTPAG